MTTATTVRKLGLRQKAVLHHLAEHGPADLAALAEAIFESPYRRGEARKSVKALEARGLVRVEREGGEIVRVSPVAS